jgi:hypothetical protein
MFAPKNLFEIPLTGLSQSNYEFSPEGESEEVGKLNIAYGHTVYRNKSIESGIAEVAVGATISALFGFGTMRTTDAFLNIDVNDLGIVAKGSYVGTGAFDDGNIVGRGYGLNLGISARTSNNITLSLALDNVYNRIDWNRSTKEYVGTLDTGEPKFILGDGQFEDAEFDDFFEDDEVDIDPFHTKSPINIRFGVGTSGKYFALAAEVGRRNEEVHFGGGARAKLAIINLYAGYRYYQEDHNLTAGIGLGGKNFIFDVGLGTRGGITYMKQKGLLLSSSLRIGF